MSSPVFFFFFFNDTATTEIYTLSLHDALPIFRYRLAVELENDVAGFHAGLFGGPAFFDGIDKGTRGAGKTERLGEFLRNLLDHDADSSATDAAGLAQLALHFHRDVGGGGE